MISDAVLDACIIQDPMSRVACETMVSTGFVVICGEITTKAVVDYQRIARDTIRKIGFTDSAMGFDARTCAVMVALDQQSEDIAMGVDKALEAKENKLSDEELEAIGAGDQGMMFGYASNETEEYMPFPAALAQKLSKKLSEVRKNGTLPYLRPDGKTQVSVEYGEDGKPLRIDAVVLSTQHAPEITQEQINQAKIRDSSSEDLRAMQDSRAARSLWTLMAEWPVTAAVHSPEKTARRLTEAQLMRRDMWQRIWSLPDTPIRWRSRYLMRSVWQNRLPLW